MRRPNLRRPQGPDLSGVRYNLIGCLIDLGVVVGAMILLVLFLNFFARG